jgi:hypothetical protein
MSFFLVILNSRDDPQLVRGGHCRQPVCCLTADQNRATVSNTHTRHTPVVRLHTQVVKIFSKASFMFLSVTFEGKEALK